MSLHSRNPWSVGQRQPHRGCASALFTILTTSIHRDVVLCPITALAFYISTNQSLYILAGEDSHLTIYDIETGKRCGRFQVFAARVIHGIFAAQGPTSSSLGSVLVWGAQSVAVFPRLHIELLLAGQTPPRPVEVEAPDWIYDGILSPYNGDRGVLVTAHNEVVPLTVGHGGRDVVLGALKSPSRPILYSACSAWAAEDCVLVAGGTVFGEVIVWEYKPGSSDEELDDCRVLEVFQGHEGSVFGVSFSQPMNLPSGARVRLLASCSDDRSIRIWGLPEQSMEHNPQSRHQDKDVQIRETGFTNSLVALAQGWDGAKGSPRELAVAIGHISRIWHIKFCQQNSDSTGMKAISLYSFGEDAHAQEWRLRLNVQQWERHIKGATGASPASCPTDPLKFGTLSPIRTIPCHSGKNIWAAAVSSHSSFPPLMATGGADGKIDLIGDHTSLGRQLPDREEIVTLSVPKELLPTANTSQPAVRDELSTDIAERDGRRGRDDGTRHAFAFVSKNRLIIATPQGRLLLADIDVDVRWAEVPTSDSDRSNLKGYTVIESFEKGIAFLGTERGLVYMYLDAARRLVAIAELPARIEDLFVVSDQEGTHAPIRLLATMRHRNAPVVLDVDPLAPSSDLSKWRQLPLDKNVNVTSANACQGTLILGSRNGALFLFRESAHGEFVQKHCRERGVRDSITAIVRLPALHGRASSCFLALSRPGLLRIFEVELDGADSVSLRLRHESSFGLAVPDAWFAQSETGPLDLILCGFRGSKFIVWNETRQKQISAFECRGHHRSYTFVSDAQNANWLRFVFAQSSTINMVSQVWTTHRTLKPGGHGRDIRGVSSNGHLLATCSEDTAIRIWKPHLEETDGETGWHCISVLTLHTAGMQCLKWLGKDYLLSSSGAEELFIWRISTIDDSLYDGPTVICESAFPFRTPDRDLRITSFDAESAVAGGGIYVSLVLSNSSLQTYFYASSGEWRPISTGRYTGACPTQIRHLRVQPGEAFEMLAAFTDGTISVWRATPRNSELAVFSDYETTHGVQAHQSAVKSLDIAKPCGHHAGRLLVVSGGDDNALAINVLEEYRTGQGFAFGERYRVSKAHAAAITGVCIVRADENEVVVVTCSNDQRVKTWRIRLGCTQHGGQCKVERVQLLSNEYSAVADPGDLELLLPQKQVMVVGVGMETWTVQDDSCSAEQR